MKRVKTTARGYGAQHQRLRRQCAARVAAGGEWCRRCGLAIHPAEPWHLGHHDEDRSVCHGPEHARCNVAAANRRRRRKGRRKRLTSRAW